MSDKYVYTFGGGKAEGNATMKNLLGGKGANLGELVMAKERKFGSSELNAARRLKSALDCECPRHIADLIEDGATILDISGTDLRRRLREGIEILESTGARIGRPLMLTLVA